MASNVDPVSTPSHLEATGALAAGTGGASNSKELEEAIHRLTAVLEIQLAQQRSWRLALRNGLLAGLGGFLGATLVISIAVALLQPFKRLEAVGPMVDRLELALRQPPRR